MILNTSVKRVCQNCVHYKHPMCKKTGMYTARKKSCKDFKEK